MFLVDDASAVGIALELFEHRNMVARLRRRLWNLLKHGHLQIVLIGPGGTGKSTLGTLLSGQDLNAAGRGKYRQSIFVEQFRLQGDLFCTIIVPPGQERRTEREWPAIFRGLAQNKYSLFINVVSWGYHALPELSYTETALYQPGMTVESFIADYTDNRRQRELAILTEMVPHLKNAPGKLKMLTVTTKQDLWWAERKRVEDYYEHGPYNASIQEVILHRGQERFMHECVSASLLMANMISAKGEALALTTAGYDEPYKNANLNNLVDTIIRFVTE